MIVTTEQAKPEHSEEDLSHQEEFDIIARSSTHYFGKEKFWLPLVIRFSHYLRNEVLAPEQYTLIFDNPVN